MYMKNCLARQQRLTGCSALCSTSFFQDTSVPKRRGRRGGTTCCSVVKWGTLRNCWPSKACGGALYISSSNHMLKVPLLSLFIFTSSWLPMFTAHR